MPKKLEMTEHVAASPETTFDVFAGFANADALFSGITKVRMLTSGPVRPGSRFQETRIMFGREASENMEVTRFERPYSYTLRAFNNGTEYLRAMTFSADDSGTRVLSTFEARPQSMMARLMSAFAGMMQKSVIKALRQDLADGKAAAEARTNTGNGEQADMFATEPGFMPTTGDAQ